MHVEKYTRSACNNMLAHYSREHISSKSDIDTARSKNNYYFGATNPRKRLQQILSSENIKCMKRKDVNVLIDIVVTIPEHWKSKPSKVRKAFFKAVTDVLYDKFCSTEKDNFVGGYIHADETSEHEHFAFVGIVIDNKGMRRVRACDVVNLQVLKTLHNDVEEAVAVKLGISVEEVGLRNGICEKVRNELSAQEDKQYLKVALTVPELKEQTALIKKLRAQNEELEIKNAELQLELDKSMHALKIWQYEEGITPIFEDVMTSL